MVSREELRAVRKLLLDKIEDLYLKIYGRDPDGLITLSQLDPQTITELRKIGDFYRRGERLPLSAIPGEYMLEAEIMPYLRGIVNNTVYARSIVDEVISAREGELTLLANLTDNYLLIDDVITEINASLETINLARINASLVEQNEVIDAINTSTEIALIDGAKVDTDNLLGFPPIGSMIDFFGATEPTSGDWKFPDGQELLSATYPTAAAMFAGIGSPAPDHFCLPNLKGKTTVMLDGTIVDFDTLHKTGGEKTVQTTVDETASHNHSQTGSVSGTQSYAPPVMVQHDASGTHEVYNTSIQPIDGDTANTGGDSAHENMPPYHVVNKLIRVR